MIHSIILYFKTLMSIARISLVLSMNQTTFLGVFAGKHRKVNVVSE